VSGSGRVVIVSCGEGGGPGGAWTGLPLLALGRPTSASLVRGGMSGGSGRCHRFGGGECDCVSIRDDLVHAD
jgi:hypothetical protein